MVVVLKNKPSSSVTCTRDTVPTHHARLSNRSRSAAIHQHSAASQLRGSAKARMVRYLTTYETGWTTRYLRWTSYAPPIAHLCNGCEDGPHSYRVVLPLGGSVQARAKVRHAVAVEVLRTESHADRVACSACSHRGRGMGKGWHATSVHAQRAATGRGWATSGMLPVHGRARKGSPTQRLSLAAAGYLD